MLRISGFVDDVMFVDNGQKGDGNRAYAQCNSPGAAHHQGRNLVTSIDDCIVLFCSVLFFSRPRSEGWPHHGRTFSINPSPVILIDSSTESPVHVLMSSSRPCVVFLACVHLTRML